MISQRAVDAIESSNTDELLRIIDEHCAAKAWADLTELRSGCEDGVARGKQLWGVVEHIRYRLALEAPGEYAGRVVSEGRARFTLGPLPEVAASRHTWAELEPYLDSGPARRTTAAERVVAGETVSEPIDELPSTLVGWEPRYQPPVYKADRLEAPSPKRPQLEEAGAPAPGITRIDDADSEEALADLVRPWLDESNGRCQTATVTGTPYEAVSALGLSQPRLGQMAPEMALAWMQWAGASGGAHGRRRGGAAGRYLTWWAMACLADLDWPVQPADLGKAISEMRFWWFDDGSPDTGWILRIAIEHGSVGLSWALSAVDTD